MIHIAIVDDEQEDRTNLLRFFEAYQKEIKEELKLQIFESGEQLLSACDENFDLICLDIEMGGKNGIEIAKEIRKIDQSVQILFVTNMAQMAIEGYEVRALDYILKPLNYYSFKIKIFNAFSIIRNKKEKAIILYTKDGMVKKSSNEICYIEVRGHYLYFHTEDNTYKQKMPMKELEKTLEGLCFKRCNNCYLVNLKYVTAVRKDEIEVNGEWLKISRPRKTSFLQSLSIYLGGGDVK